MWTLSILCKICFYVLDWHLGMGMSLEETAKGVTRMKEVSSFRICLVPQVMGSESEEKLQQGVYYMMTGRVWIWRRGEKSEKWINVVRLTIYLACSASLFPGNSPVSAGDWDKGLSGRKEAWIEKLKWPIRGGTREKGEDNQVVNYKAGDKAVGLDLLKSRERLISQLFHLLP